MLYPCTHCGEMHEGWPALAFITPDNYEGLSAEDKKRYVKELNDDFCVIAYEDQTDYFIRAVLYQKVIDHCEDLQYGVWVSLSKKSFEDYKNNFNSDNQTGTYFGYLCNQIPAYKTTTAIKTTVALRTGRQRPEIIPHKDEMDNDFVKDYYIGITKEEAEKRIKKLFQKFQGN